MATSAAQLLKAQNSLASHGIASLSAQAATASAEFAALAALIETLATAIGADTPGAPVTNALAAVEAQVLVAQAAVLDIEDLAPAE